MASRLVRSAFAPAATCHALVRRRPRAALLLLAATAAAAPLVPWWCDRHVGRAASGRIHADVATLDPRPVALLLGTAPEIRGRPNAFYRARIEAAAQLFKAGKVRAILASGDNGTRHYNEPLHMQRDLVAAGVPAEFITLDYAGFRTRDSVIRARDVFGQRSLIVVSQRFHAERAIFIASRLGIDATALAAADPPSPHSRRKVRTREILARTLAVADHLAGRSPKFLGPREPLPLRPH